MLRSITILPGRDKTGRPEGVAALTLCPGEVYAIVGNTGAGKSRLISDIEQLAAGDTVTGRRVSVDMDGAAPLGQNLIAHLSQNMRFVLDTSAGDFIARHCACRGRDAGRLTARVIACANSIAAEPIGADTPLNALSGGQSRALMIADIALVCDSPIVLVDEIENAGIDKERALGCLMTARKLVLLVTHDPHTALLGQKRVIMRNGAIWRVRERLPEEDAAFGLLTDAYGFTAGMREKLRNGDVLCAG